jgi:hypothetical protein
MSRTCPSWPRRRLSSWPKPPSGRGSRTGAAFRRVRTLLGPTAEVVTPCRPEGQVRVRGRSASPYQTRVGRVRRSLVLSPAPRLLPDRGERPSSRAQQPLPAPLDQLFSALPVGPFSGRLANRADLDIRITRPRGTAGAGTRPPGQVAKITSATPRCAGTTYGITTWGYWWEFVGHIDCSWSGGVGYGGVTRYRQGHCR